MSMRGFRMVLIAGGGLGLLALVYYFGADSIASALMHVTWWQFLLICLVHSLNVVVDSYGWRYAITTDRAPFHRLVAARCAGDAVNAISAVAAVRRVSGTVLRRLAARRRAGRPHPGEPRAARFARHGHDHRGAVVRRPLRHLLRAREPRHARRGRSGRVRRLRLQRWRGTRVHSRPPRLSGGVDRRGDDRPDGDASSSPASR